MSLWHCNNNCENHSIVRLKFLGRTKGGSGFPDNEQGITGEELPFFKVKDLAQENVGDYIFQADSSISLETAKRLRAFVFPKDSIVFAKVGAALLLHRFKLIGQPSCIDNNMMGFMANNSILNYRYATYAFSLFNFEDIVNPGAVPSLNEEQINNQTIPVPTIDAQVQMVEFLDRETARLDSLISAKENLLSLLAEKRRALVTSAVNRGINAKVKLRNSGIPWLGEIPEHWKIERSKWLFKERDIRSEFGDEEMLTVSHLTGVTTRAEKNVNMFLAESQEGSKICEAGDLVINTLWAWMGAMGVSSQRGIVSPAYNVYEPSERLDKAYLDYLVRMPVFAQEAIRYSKGVWSSRLRLYPEGLYEIWFPVPPVEEQRAIAEYLGVETKKIDELQEATERTIALLRERRTALIAAAVTGHLKDN